MITKIIIDNSKHYRNEDVWLTQAQLVEIYQSSKSNISEHLTNIFADKELEQDACVKIERCKRKGVRLSILLPF